jgi:hypothetical protein
MMKRRLKESGQALSRDILPLEDLREEMLRPFGLAFRGPMLVSLQPYGEDYVVLHSFNGHPVEVWREAHGATAAEPDPVLPAMANTECAKAGEGFRVRVDPHTLTCFRITRWRE